MYMLYRLLLILLHVFYSCLETFTILWCFVRKKYEKFWCKSEIQDDFYYVSNCLKTIKAVPSHLAFILINEEVVSFEDLANFVLWSLAAGVSFVSFYDHDGLLKRCESKLRAEISRRGCQSKNVIWGSTPLNGSSSNGASSLIGENGVKNGFKNGSKPAHKIRVSFLSADDGREMFARAATVLARETVDSKDVTACIKQTENALRSIYQIDGPENSSLLPEPELAVWCGSLNCNAGFLPWHIRITEFLQLHTHHDVSVHQFTSLLSKYSRCEQRFGK